MNLTKSTFGIEFYARMFRITNINDCLHSKWSIYFVFQYVICCALEEEEKFRRGSFHGRHTLRQSHSISVDMEEI